MCRYLILLFFYLYKKNVSILIIVILLVVLSNSAFLKVWVVNNFLNYDVNAVINHNRKQAHILHTPHY